MSYIKKYHCRRLLDIYLTCNEDENPYYKNYKKECEELDKILKKMHHKTFMDLYINCIIMAKGDDKTT